ncbi:Fic family protein [Haliangium sp.]|uniref:Fic family protein n=1 Tax=Haliangium sp. TaxID=2663208 RepID=UPI003D10DE51
MLRYKAKEDLDARGEALEEIVGRWRERVNRVSPRLREAFHQRLMISLIYHDAALEGEVLSYSEIKAAIDPTIISDSTLIPSYENIERYHQACMWVDEQAQVGSDSLSDAFSIDSVREIYARLAPSERAAGLPYRTENPLHRLYYHEIVAPEDIAAGMAEFEEWLSRLSTRYLGPVERAAEVHLRLMAIFPWAEQSGRCARITANLLLRQAGYPWAVLHSIDRQAYYEALRNERDDLVSLYLEAIETSAMSEIRVYDQAEQDTLRAS